MNNNFLVVVVFGLLQIKLFPLTCIFLVAVMNIAEMLVGFQNVTVDS
jgi:hypothetical protein